jgi:hypothetical protein
MYRGDVHDAKWWVARRSSNAGSLNVSYVVQCVVCSGGLLAVAMQCVAWVQRQRSRAALENDRVYWRRGMFGCNLLLFWLKEVGCLATSVRCLIVRRGYPHSGYGIAQFL